jgi:Fic family protein
MFITTRQSKGKTFYYLDYSLTLGSLKKHFALYIGPELKEKQILEQYNKLITKITLERTRYVLKNYKTILKESEIFRLEEIRVKLDILKRVLPKSYDSYKQDEFVKYAQGTSAVEGNSIRLREAQQILEKGISISGHTVREVKEIENLEKVRIYLQIKKEFNERTMLKCHSILIDNKKDKPGKYRDEPMYITASKVKPIHESKVKEETKKIFDYYEKNKKTIYPFDLACELHPWFEQIHPFFDGNGRIGREFMNFVLLKNNFPRIIINLSNRETYIKTLETLQLEKHYKKFTHYIYLQLDSQFKELDELIKDSEKTIVKKLIS